ncbi:MAG: hypothetical protein ACRBN8_07720 [Nannocystales bacterium]
MRALCTTLLLSALSPGCVTPSETASPVDAQPPSPSMSPAVATPSTGLHETVARIAVTAHTVEEFEFRLDEQGALIKQAIYHDDASAVSEVVKAKAMELYPGATIVAYETEFYADAGIVHEVEVKTADGQECEVSATPDRTLRYQECELEMADVPPQITAAVKSAYPDGKLLEVETKKGPSLDIVTAEVESGGVEYYVTMSPQGAIEAVHKRIEALVEIPVALP